MHKQNVKRIFITSQFEGYHRYPEAPEQVAYLRNIHRHIFHVKVTMTVSHDDREVEFIMLKHEVNEHIKNIFKYVPDTRSCEMMASYILDELYSRYHREIMVEVNEDGENGAIVGDVL